MPPDRHAYCAAQVRRVDRDRYLTALFVPAAARAHVLALYAFNSEIARAREVVSEPQLAAIRLQWWRETLEDLYAGRSRAQPIVEALADTIAGRGLSRVHFDRLIDAREADLADAPIATLAELEAYAENSSAPLLRLVLEVLGYRDGTGHIAARDVGTAHALVGLLRAVPFHARAKRLYLPAELLDAHGVSRGDLFEPRPSAGLNQVVKLVAARAGERLRAARALRIEVLKRARRGLLLATLADRYLGALHRADGDVFALPRDLPNAALRLAFARCLGRY